MVDEFKMPFNLLPRQCFARKNVGKRGMVHKHLNHADNLAWSVRQCKRNMGDVCQMFDRPDHRRRDAAGSEMSVREMFRLAILPEKLLF